MDPNRRIVEKLSGIALVLGDLRVAVAEAYSRAQPSRLRTRLKQSGTSRRRTSCPSFEYWAQPRSASGQPCMAFADRRWHIPLICQRSAVLLGALVLLAAGPLQAASD